MGSKKAVKVGYRYLFGIHMGIGRGPVDELIELKVGDKSAWAGSVTANQTISINAPSLFGGDSGEGGIQGSLDVMMGAPDQPVNARLAAMLGGLVPAFRGVCTLFYDGLVTSLNPYPKSWKWRVRRALKGWDGATWYPAKCVISMEGGQIKAMNPAHIIYECLTNRDWGGGMDRSRLDDASFLTAADALYAEGFGLCLRWVRQDSLSTFVSNVLDHIAGNLFVSRSTGLFELTLVRDNYDPETLPLFDEESGLLAINEDDNAAISGAANEIIVKWRSPIDDSDRQKRERNLAAIQSDGQILSASIEYPGIPTADLAGRVAVRDLRARSTGLKRFKVQLDRRGRLIKPGAPFRIRSLSRGITMMVVRAGRIEDGTLANAAITITAVQDSFGLPATSLTPPQQPGWVPPDTTPAAVTIQRLVEITWRDLAQTIDAANLALVDATTCYLGAIAVRPTSLSLGYELQTRVGGAAFETRAEGDFCPSGLLVSAISPIAISFQLASTSSLDLVALGSAALIDDEIVRIDAIDLGTNTLTVARGCIDTVPASHAIGARLWCFDDYAGADPTEYSPGVTVQVRLLPHTSSGPLDPVLAATDSLLMAQRQARPYPPGNLTINGEHQPTVIEGLLSITWAHRDRLLQADQLVDWIMGSIGPEPGTTYTVLVRNPVDNAVLHEATGIDGDSYSVEFDHAGGLVDLIVTSVRGGLTSWQAPSCQFDYTGEAPELLMAMEGGEFFSMESGEPMAFEADSYGVYSSMVGSVKISELLPAPDALTGDELIPVVQDGVNYRITAGDLRDFIAATIPDGAPGLSAYQAAVNNGFVGTEVEWLVSLVGADGADGSAGAAGGPTQVRSVAGTSYTLVAVADNGVWLECTAVEVRLPETVAAGFAINDFVEVRQTGATQITFVADTSSVTLDLNTSLFGAATRYQGAVVVLKVTGTNTWALVGALADAP